jgi:hypothetical protein
VATPFDRVRFWNATPAERRGPHPADAHVPAGGEHFVRAVDVDAEPTVVYRWLCQIKVAPYSYDLIDNLGRRSPQVLTPGADQLEVGQRFQIGPLVDFSPGRMITFVAGRRGARVFGPVAMSYEVVPGRATRSRIVLCVALGPARRGRRWWHAFLGAGDLVMARRQLLNLRDLAEATPG